MKQLGQTDKGSVGVVALPLVKDEGVVRVGLEVLLVPVDDDNLAQVSVEVGQLLDVDAVLVPRRVAIEPAVNNKLFFLSNYRNNSWLFV